MNHTPPPELTQDIKGPFEVASYDGNVIGKKTWVLREVNTGKQFTVTPDTTSNWPKERKQPGGPCIILSVSGPTMIGMHLGTGAVFSDHAPPTGVKG